MIWTNIKRIIRGGFKSFWRNGLVSLSAILVLTVSLFVLQSLMFFSILTHSYLGEVREKVDVNVYFDIGAKEEDILNLKQLLTALPEVAKVEYVSRDQALANFKERHKDDALTLAGLEELGENPLPAVLNIKAKEPSQYGTVAKFLQSKSAFAKDGGNIIESINYNKNKLIIDRLVKIISASEKLGLIITIVFVLMAIVITFNTIRLIIYSSREEISVMKLVGASNTYIRGPFVVSGIIDGLIAAILTLGIFYPIAYYSNNLLSNFGGDVNLLSYYVQNFGQIFAIIVGSGIALGAISSYLAVKRYLNV